VILDEPTNHLDIDSRAALIEAINDFPGAVILISHDRYLLDACADALWLVAGGTVAPFDGDMEDYRRLVLTGSVGRGEGGGEGTGGAQSEARVSRTETRRAAAEKRAELAPLRSRIAAADKTIARLTKEIGRIDAELATDLFARDPGKATALAKARSDAVAALAAAEEDWLAASAEYEAAAG
jgi:ATP-binding cassette subfamily F protein 3